MGARKIHRVERAADREKVFLDHYEWLFRRALRLSRGERPEAEDLVHDCYIRFVQASSDVQLDDEDRLRGYLYRTLQHLAHSNYESRGRDTFRSLEAVDYDSAEFALASVDRSNLLYIRSDLAGICDYCCLRRKTSRAGSVLIFRFFLNYYPSEIVRLLKISSAAVYKLTETGRLEAKAFLTRPDALHFLGSSARPSSSFSRRLLPESPLALFAELKRRIFADPEGPCFASGRLEQLYASDSEEQLTTRDVAHLASCSTCLERANHLLRLLGLPPWFSDFNDPNDDEPPRSSPGTSQEPLTRMRKKARDIHEHRPKNLELVIDGEVYSAQQITSAKSHFQIKLNSPSMPRFIEVRSEQRVRLLCLDVENYDVVESSQLQAEAALSDKRVLSLELDLGSGAPIVDVSYYDPILESANNDWAREDELRPPVYPDTQTLAASTPTLTLVQRVRSIFSSWFGSSESRWPASLLAATTVVALVAFGAFWTSQPRHNSPVQPQAVELLARSQREEDTAILRGGAAHRTFSLEIRSQDGSVIESGTVETLRSKSPKRSAAHYRNAHGDLLAGRWENSSGKVTTYTKKTGIHRPSDETNELTPSNAWMHVPEAEDFEELSAYSKNLSVKRDTDAFEISFENPDTAHRPTTLLSADLVLTADSMRPVRETLLMRDGDRTREYQFRELSYEVLSPGKVIDRDFDPDPSTLDGSPTGSRGSLDSETNSAHLALEALQLLDNLGSNVEQIVNLERKPDGTIELNGVFPTSAQKLSVTHVFKSLRGGQQLRLALHSSDEPTSAAAVPRPISIESLASVDVGSQRIPFDPELRAGLTAEGFSGAQLEDRLRVVASSIAARSAQLHREAWSLCQIAATDFTPDELRQMAPQDQMLWLTLLDKHLQSFEQEAALLRSDLSHVQQDPNARSPATSVAVSPLPNADQLGRATVLLNHDTEELDRLLTAGFTLTPSGLPANINLAAVTQLTSNLETEERSLRETIERLYRSERADVKE